MGIMNPEPEGRNDLGSLEMFNERLNYKQYAFTPFDPIPIDMIYEKPFYGKVDKEGHTIYPTEINMEQLPGPGLLLAHDFVAKAYLQLKDVVEFNVRTRSTRFDDLFPNGFAPKAAMKNFHELYQNHFVDTVYDIFINNYIMATTRKRQVRTFADFVEQFVGFCHHMRDVFPVSKTAFIMSPLCPNAISGLIIEVEKLAIDDDEQKYDGWISKPSFREYVKLASSFGFYVDKNCPWRLAANMDHPIMIEKFMKPFGTSYADGSVFRDYFYRSEYYSYEDFKSRMWYAYKDLLTSGDTTTFGLISSVKNCGGPLWADVASGNFKTTWKEGFLETISDNFDGEFQKQYPDSFFLPYYFRMRLSESHKDLNSRHHRAKIKKILNINKRKGIEKAIDIIALSTMQSDIYEPKKKATLPQRIKYFGKNITSGLHSYKERDKVETIYDLDMDRSKAPKSFDDYDNEVETDSHELLHSEGDH